MIEGRIEALRGHIYGCTESRQANLDTTTTKEISGYAAFTLNMAMTWEKAIEEMKLIEIVHPKDLPAKTVGKKNRWNNQEENYLGKECEDSYSIIWGQVSDAMAQDSGTRKLQDHEQWGKCNKGF